MGLTWGYVMGDFSDHPKVLELLDEEDGVAAVGLWTLCLSWAHRNLDGKGRNASGLIPKGLLTRYVGAKGPALAGLLVHVGLWEERDGGWLFHDFGDYQYFTADDAR